MKFRIEYTSTAERELYQSFEWILEESKSNLTANRWVNGIHEAVESLHSHPERCGLAPENEYFEHEVRQLIHGMRRGRYRILFTIQKEVVVILHVRHGARKNLR